MRILVTGANGFLGSHLVERLRRDGNVVRALVRDRRRARHIEQPGVEIMEGDLRQPATARRAMAGMESAYHAGAAVKGDWDEYEASTVRATRWMLEAALSQRIERFVLISSLAVYRTFFLETGAMVDETSPVEVSGERIGPYAYSKVEAERLVVLFHRRGLPVTVVRPGIVYGPRGRVLFPHLGVLARPKLFLTIGRGNGRLPLTYIDNAIDGIVAAGVNSRAVGRTYNIVDDNDLTQRAYLDRYREATGARFVILPTPIPQLARGLRLVSALRSTPLIGPAMKKIPVPDHYRTLSKIKNLRFSSDRAQSELRWRPTIGRDEGLRRTFEWHRENAASQDS